MRYVAAFCYALAIAAHTGSLLNTLVLGGLVFVGVVATLFAVEGIIKDALQPRESGHDYMLRVGRETLEATRRKIEHGR